MGSTIRIVVRTDGGCWEFTNVAEIFVAANSGGVKILQNKIGWDILPIETEEKDNDQDQNHQQDE